MRQQIDGNLPRTHVSKFAGSASIRPRISTATKRPLAIVGSQIRPGRLLIGCGVPFAVGGATGRILTLVDLKTELRVICSADKQAPLRQRSRIPCGLSDYAEYSR